MRFGRIRDDLEQFRDAGTLTADSVLSLFFDLCEDVREETGMSVDRLPVSSVDSLMKRLPWTGNTVRRIYQANAEEVLSPERKKLLTDVDDKLREIVADAQEAAAELEKTREQRTKLREAQEHLRASLEAQDRTEAECAALTAQINDLQERVRPELTQKKQQLEQARTAALEENRRLQQVITETTAGLDKVRVQTQGLVQEKNRQSVLYSDRQKEVSLLEGDRKALEEKVLLADSGVRELQDKIDALKVHLADKDYSALKEKQLAELEALTKAKTDYETLSKEHAQTVKELQEARGTCEAQRQAAGEEVAALQTALGKIRRERDEAQRKAEELSAQQEAELAQLEEESANQKLAAEARQLAILQRKQQVDQEAEALLQKEKDLETELSQMSGERTAQRIEAAKRRIAVMQQVREEMDAHYAQLLLSLGKTPEQVKETALFESRLDQTEADIMECGRLYRKLLRALEGKTK